MKHISAIKKACVTIVLVLTSISSHAALECKGSAYGLDLNYTFTKANAKNLSLHIITKMDSKAYNNIKGTAVYASTVENDLFGQKTIDESYYYFIHGSNSYTELIGLAQDLKAMSTSRPMPESSTGNYAQLKCNGSL